MKIFNPLYDAVSWVILNLHQGFNAIGMSASWSWNLAIVGLVVLIRIALIPLFVKQIKSMRNMQMLQPEIKKVQERFKGDRERTSQELMKLYKEHNTNPLSSCLPVLAQSPFFFALFKVLSAISGDHKVGVLSQMDVDNARTATFLGANLADKFVGAHTVHVQIVTIVMIVAMSGSQFYTQRQLMTKNMPTQTGTASPFMQQQKVMMYLFPILFGVFGINFPVGVLLYWLVSNFWSMGQQLIVIRTMPTMGSPAHDALLKRKSAGAAKGDTPAAKPGVSLGKFGVSLGKSGTGGSNGATDAPPEQSGPIQDPAAPTSPPVRQQPQRQSRSKRTGAKKR